MEEIGIPELTAQQLERLCEIAEETARDYVLSKVSSRKISELNINVDAEGAKPVTVNVDIEIILSPIMKGYDSEILAKEATEKAFESTKKYLSGLVCKSTK